MKLMTSFLLVMSVQMVQAQERYSIDRGETFIDGYDPVSYFDGTPKEGDPGVYIEVEGRKLLFSTEENKKRYEADPAHYFPVYGGWCAIAMVDDTFVIPNYKFFKIQDDRLYFFRVQAFFNGLTQWEKDPDLNKIKADTNYSKHFGSE